MLAVDVVQGKSDLGADRRNLVRRQRRFVEQRFHRRAGDKFHHDIRPLEIASGDKARRVRPSEPRQNHLLDFVADDGERIFTGPQQRDLHQHRQIIAIARHAPEGRHSAGLERFNETKPVDYLAGFEFVPIHISGSLDQAGAQDQWQPCVAHLACGGFVVIRHAHVDQDVAFRIKRTVAGGRIVIARLSDRTNHRDPAPLRE